MPSSPTTRLRLEKQAAGENDTTWGTNANTVFDLIDFAIGGMTTFTLSGSKTLSNTNYVADEARAAFLNITSGTGGTVTIPNVEKIYLVKNATSGTVTFTTGSGTTADVLTGETQIIVCIAGNVIYAAFPAQATAAQFRANTATKVLTTDKVWSSAETVGLTDAATIALDMSTFINATVTLGDNRTLGNPTNPKVGQSGFIAITQDGTGSRTLAYASNWEFANGVAPTLSTAASTKDVLFYQVLSATSIFGSLVKGVV